MNQGRLRNLNLKRYTGGGSRFLPTVPDPTFGLPQLANT